VKTTNRKVSSFLVLNYDKHDSSSDEDVAGAEITALCYSDLIVPDEVEEEAQSEKSSDEDDTEEENSDDDDEDTLSKKNDYEGFDFPIKKYYAVCKTNMLFPKVGSCWTFSPQLTCSQTESY